MYKYIYFFTALLCTPLSLLNAGQVTLNTIVGTTHNVVLRAVPVAVLVALAVFIWGAIKMIAGLKVGQSDKAISEGKKRMFWGLIGLFMVVSIWGVVEIIRVTFVETSPPNQDAPIISW